MCCEQNKDSDFPGSAQGAFQCDQALWGVAALEDVHSHRVQVEPSHRVPDSDRAGDQLLPRLRSGRALLHPM